MKNLKMYVKNEDLNEYEKEHNKISFKRLVNKLFTDLILCNDITKLFYNEIGGKYCEPEFEIGTDYDEENETQIDVYQYFVVDFESWKYDNILKKYSEQLGKEFILYYIDELDLYILGVTHLGTGWDYVLTDIEPTENIDESNL